MIKIMDLSPRNMVYIWGLATMSPWRVPSVSKKPRFKAAGTGSTIRQRLQNSSEVELSEPFSGTVYTLGMRGEGDAESPTLTADALEDVKHQGRARHSLRRLQHHRSFICAAGLGSIQDRLQPLPFFLGAVSSDSVVIRK